MTRGETQVGPENIAEKTRAERSVTRVVELNASASVVWHALTDSRELARWFPMEARVTPGPEGTIVQRWRDGEIDESRIIVWRPEQHLRLVSGAKGWAGIVTDYELEARGGRTVLRVVSSGFSEGDRWDELLDAFGNGWTFELFGLAHYLERHLGTDRHVAWARRRASMPDESAWARLVGAGGWLGVDAEHLSAGDSFVASTGSGDMLHATLHSKQRPTQLVATLHEWNNALLRIHLYGGEASLWLSTYGVDPADVAAIERRWQVWLDSQLDRQAGR